MSGNGRSGQVEQARPRLGAVWEKKGRSEGNGRRRDFFGCVGQLVGGSYMGLGPTDLI